MKTYINEYIKDKYKNDVHFKIKTLLSTRLRSTILQKDNITVHYLGCTIDYFKKWIESQFNTDMKWENHGPYWHFDHVRPCASYDLSNQDEALKCFNWKNIRPLYAIENIQKKDKYDEELINKHNKIVENFINLQNVPKLV